MTKFDSEAVGVRAGRKQGFTSGKERRKDMERFQRTGRHPDLDPAAAPPVMHALPERDPNRPHVFFDLKTRSTKHGAPSRPLKFLPSVVKFNSYPLSVSSKGVLALCVIGPSRATSVCANIMVRARPTAFTWGEVQTE